MKTFLPLLLSLCISGLFASEPISLADLNSTVAKAQPGQTIVIANGVYNDVSLKVVAVGTLESPITIKAETAGEVIIKGKSTLKIGGEHLVIEGLHFKDGELTKTPVITFKEGGKAARYCRLTNCVIDNYKPEDRFLKSDWVNLYGDHNQIDHCTFTNKYNAGLMLAVKLSGKEEHHYHKIDHNHFLNRPRLGSNGGETVRIGTSTYSLKSAKVEFSNNYFEHCSGEVEILSVKSTDNVISGNVFYECEGVLALRHGNNNVVTHNSFIGNNVPNTGGIRVINAGHTVTNNHFQELTGFRFWSALAVMNGVPNSAINRYHQVKNVTLKDNSFYNCDNIGFGIGTDGERTALPEGVTFASNYIYSDDAQEVHFLDDMSGIAFEKNVINAQVEVPVDGFKTKKMTLLKNDGVYSVKGVAEVNSVKKADCGVNWVYAEQTAKAMLQAYHVNYGAELEDILKMAIAGSEIILEKAETYYINQSLIVNSDISLKAKDGLVSKPVIKFSKNQGQPIITIAAGVNLSISGIAFEGLTEDGIPPCAIKTKDSPFLKQYNLYVDACEFYNFNAGGRTAFSATPTSYANNFEFTNCIFHNISGIALNLKAEKDDVGRYNAENVLIKNCLFYDVMGSAIDLYRGGNDESTSGPKLTIDQCTFYNVENRELGSSINLTGAQEVNITNCLFAESGKSGRALNMEAPRWAKCEIDYCNFYNIGRIETFYERKGEHMYDHEPLFVDVENNDFTLSADSPLVKLSKTGSTIGYQE